MTAIQKQNLCFCWGKLYPKHQLQNGLTIHSTAYIHVQNFSIPILARWGGSFLKTNVGIIACQTITKAVILHYHLHEMYSYVPMNDSH